MAGVVTGMKAPTGVAPLRALSFTYDDGGTT